MKRGRIRGRIGFGATWWGRAWIEALEHRARLDPNRLPRGRTYARWGRVGELTIVPGEVSATVRGSLATPYEVRLRVREFTPKEWDRVLAAVSSRAAHAAALLDGELDPAVVEEVEKAGISLLPGAGELGPSCSCPDWADPCKHAAAVCYLVADSMDADPFTIFLLRGRTRDQVLAGLRRLRAASSVSASRVAVDDMERIDPGMEARGLFARRRGRQRARLPPLPLPPDHPGNVATLAIDPPQGMAISGNDLAGLARDAARRAWELTRGSGDGGLRLTADADLARLAAERLGRPGFDDFATGVGAAPRALVRLALAWRSGGAAALEVLEGPAWQPPRDEIEEGAAALRSVLRRFSVRGERVTNREAGVQLRYGRDGLWYLCLYRSGMWEVHDPPEADPQRLIPLVTRRTGAGA